MTRITDILIPAATGGKPGFVTERIAGRIVTCVTSTSPFQVSKDNRSRLDLNTGQDTGDTGAEEFGTLTFYNSTAAVITARVAVGYEKYTPDKSVNATVNTTVTVSGKNSATYTLSQSLVNGADLSGLDALVNRRKSLIVQNRGAQTVEVQGSNGGAGFIIAPGDPAFQIESGEVFKILFSGAGAKDARILETFYA